MSAVLWRRLEERLAELVFSPQLSRALILEHCFDHPQLRTAIRQSTSSAIGVFPMHELCQLIDVCATCKHQAPFDSDFYEQLAIAVALHDTTDIGSLTPESVLQLNSLLDFADRSSILPFLRVVVAAQQNLCHGDLRNLIRTLSLLSEVGNPTKRDVLLAVHRCVSPPASQQQHAPHTLLDLLDATKDEHCAVANAIKSDAVIQLLAMNSTDCDYVPDLMRRLTSMGCFSAVGATLLKFHAVVERGGHAVWRAAAEAALAAHVTNESTVRCLFKRGSQLRSSMTMREVLVWIRCLHCWWALTTPAWRCAKSIAVRIHEVAADDTPGMAPYLLIQMLREVLSNFRREEAAVAWAITTAAVRFVPTMAASEVRDLAEVLCDHRFRHDPLIERIVATASSEFDDRCAAETAVQVFRLCGVFRVSFRASLEALAPVLVRHLRQLTRRESIVVLRTCVQCDFANTTLIDAILAATQSFVHTLDAAELHIVLAAYRFTDRERKPLLAAVAERAVQLALSLPTDFCDGGDEKVDGDPATDALPSLAQDRTMAPESMQRNAQEQCNRAS